MALDPVTSAMHDIVHNEYRMDEILGQADYKGNYPCCVDFEKIREGDGHESQRMQRNIH